MVISRCARRAQPSPELQRYFDAAGAGVGARVMAQLDALAAAVFPPAPPPPGPAFMQTSVALEHRREVRRPRARARTRAASPRLARPAASAAEPAAMPPRDAAAARIDAPPLGSRAGQRRGPSSVARPRLRSARPP